MAELTKKQEDFCNYYLETGNASEAYRRAYSCAKMTSNSIHTNASRLLADAKIASRVKELQGELKKRSDISKDEVVQSLANIARANILDYICIEDPSEISNLSEQSLTVRDLATLTLAQQQCIKSITTAKGGLKIELYDRITAIDRLFKILGWDSSTPLEQKADLVARIIIGEIETEKKYFASNEHDVK